MPHLYLVCGRSYAGKTTFARSLAAATGALHISFDDPLTERGLDPRKMSEGDWDSVYQTTDERVTRALGAGMSIVLDGANKRRDRDIARALAATAGAEVTLYYLAADEDECWRRWQRNGERNDRAQLARETMERSLAYFEPPGPDEQAITTGLDG